MVLSLAAMAQTPEVTYCSIWGGKDMGYNKGRVFINYGQDDAKSDWLVDEHGEVISFATLIHAANYLAKYGWRIICVDKSDTNTIILEKRVDDISCNWLVDSNGKGLHFNSMIQAINYMSERGWELEAAYNSHAPYYLNENKIETRHTLIMSKMVR